MMETSGDGAYMVEEIPSLYSYSVGLSEQLCYTTPLNPRLQANISNGLCIVASKALRDAVDFTCFS